MDNQASLDIVLVAIFLGISFMVVGFLVYEWRRKEALSELAIARHFQTRNKIRVSLLDGTIEYRLVGRANAYTVDQLTKRGLLAMTVASPVESQGILYNDYVLTDKGRKWARKLVEDSY
jgi:hypothetical protein